MSIAKVRFWLIGVFGTVLMVAGLVVLAGLARETGSKMVVNALAGNSKAIGTAVRIQIERAFELGISLDELVGVDTVLEGELQRHRELSFFALVQKGAAAEPNAASDGGKVIAFVTRAKVTDAQRDEMKRLIIKPGDAELVSESYRATKMDVTDAQAMARQQAAAATEVVVPAAPQEAASSPVQPAAPQASVSQASLVIGYPVNYIDEQVNAVATDLIVAVLIALVLVTEFLRYASQHSTLREFFRFIEFKKMDKILTAACVYHKGSYSTLGAAYAFVFKWIEDNGYVPCEGPRESYIDGIWNKEDENDWLTELQVPIIKK